MGVIYSITNKINGRVYVGQTTNFNVRYYNHTIRLLNGNHIEGLQNDFDKYGPTAFDYNIIVECDESKMDELEQFYIKELNAFEDDGGYNLTTGGKSNYKFAKSTLEKLSNRQLELFKDPNYVDKICNIRKEVANRPEFREHLKNISQMTPEKREKIRNKVKASWTEERRKEKSKEVSKRYEDQEERKKTAEATKAGMAKLPKEKLSRRHLSPYLDELLLEIIRDIRDPNTKTTQKGIAEKYNISLAAAKGLKAGKHPIYKDIEEGKYKI